jgi:hypothetical protein
LEAYRPAGADDVEMITNYFWDIDLAESLVPSLHAAELALRNTIHEAMSFQRQTEQWFYLPGLLQPGQLGQVAYALEQLSRRKAQPTAGRVIAELSSGFWVTLLSGPYEQPIWQPNRFELLRRAFPHCPRPHHQAIHARFNEIRRLRNRVFHFEAVWDRPNLQQDHLNIHEAVGWISPAMQQAILAVDIFPTVLNSKAQVEAELKRHLGLP